MSTSRSQQSTIAGAAAPALSVQSGSRELQSGAPSASSQKFTGYGLPCAKCHLYYPAVLDSCPTCHHKERVSVVAPKMPLKRAQTGPDPIPQRGTLEAEREEFLRQFKSQLVEAHADRMSAAGAACKMEENHPGSQAVAEICGLCFERVQERLDACEAALQIDVKDAAQIVYDAVWANASDPSKTYQNAASALLTELRKRAGISGATAIEPLE